MAVWEVKAVVKAGRWDGGCGVQERYDREVDGGGDTLIEGSEPQSIRE